MNSHLDFTASFVTKMMGKVFPGYYVKSYKSSVLTVSGITEKNLRE